MNIFNLFYFVFDTYIDTDFALFLKFYISKFTVSKTTVYFHKFWYWYRYWYNYYYISGKSVRRYTFWQTFLSAFILL